MPAPPAQGRGVIDLPARPQGAATAETPTPTPARPRPIRARKVARIVDPESCLGCGLCADVCPRGAVSVADVAVIDEALCIGCEACVDECPEHLIVVETSS